MLVKDFSRTTTYKLANFGTAVQLATPKSKFISKLGTCGYIAPEILKGQACNCAADIYSLGATIYMLFTGRLPFEDEKYEKMCTKDKEQPLNLIEDPLVANLSESAKNLLSGMLEKDPSRRLTVD